MGVCEELQVEAGPSGHRRPGGPLIARGQEVRWYRFRRYGRSYGEERFPPITKRWSFAATRSEK